MKKIIHHIRLQPQRMRTLVAFLTALILTGGIGYFWVRSWVGTPFISPQTTQETKGFQSLFQNIQEAFQDRPVISDDKMNTIQIIDQNTTPSTESY